MHQYIQHNWSPALYAVLLLALAILFVAGMLLFLREGTTQQRGYSARHHVTK
jgi:cbb3-type cytochrome oxidase subunit 3